MQRYSAFSLLKHAISHHENWQRAWRNPEPKKHYDAIVVGGGGHGLATAYYLAKEYGMKNVAVLEKGYLGGGNTGRNTTIVRSNYLWDEAAHLYEHALKLWESLSMELNYNVMFSQRGVLNLATLDIETRHCTLLQQINTQGIGGSCITPGNGIMSGDAAAWLPGCTENRVASPLRSIDDGDLLFDLLGCEHFGVDAVQPISARASDDVPHILQRMAQIHHPPLAEHHVVVEILA